MAWIGSVIEGGSVNCKLDFYRERYSTYGAFPFCSPGLYGVLKSSGLLAGSAFTLVTDGVSTLRLFVLLIRFADPTLGVLGARASSLHKSAYTNRGLKVSIHSKYIPITLHISWCCPTTFIRIQHMRLTSTLALQTILHIFLE